MTSKAHDRARSEEPLCTDGNRLPRLPPQLRVRHRRNQAEKP
ncbi:hypothetical protein XCR_0032 [Xanthomonas campestris pv. raphani 756C]|nr:hypothetical protein XCR_0032 [Xanthomonas campestris pv. raphani 756C]